MNPCRQCGAELPEDARFCLQCGTPVAAAETQQAAHGKAEMDFIQPGLAGGMFLGLLSSLPVINLGNCLCCMWIVGGGAIATLLLSKQRPPALLTYGDGAFAGVLSGFFGAIVATIVSIPMRIVSARFFEDQNAVEEAFRELPELQGPLRDLFLRLASSEISVVTVTFTFFMNLIVFALFAMLGGILTVALLQKQETQRTKAQRY